MKYRRRPPWWLLAAYVPLFGLVAAAVVAGTRGDGLFLGGGPRSSYPFLAATLVLIAGFMAFSSWSHRVRIREARALAAWSGRHGLGFRMAYGKDPSYRLLRRKDVAAENIAEGAIVGARTGAVAHIAISRRRYRLLAVVPLMNWLAFAGDDLWTVVQVKLGKRDLRHLERLLLRRTGVRDAALVGALLDAATPLRHVELESVELHDTYALEVADGADDIAVRRLFEPAFIVELIDRSDWPLVIDVEDGMLTVALQGRILDEALLDDLLGVARRLATRLVPAIRDEASPSRRGVVQPVWSSSRLMWVVAAVAIALPFGFMVWTIEQSQRDATARAASRGGGRGDVDALIGRATITDGDTRTYAGSLPRAGTLRVSRRGAVEVWSSDALAPGVTIWQRRDGGIVTWSCTKPTAPATGRATCRKGETFDVSATFGLLSAAGLRAAFAGATDGLVIDQGTARCALDGRRQGLERREVHPGHAQAPLPGGRSPRFRSLRVRSPRFRS